MQKFQSPLTRQHGAQDPAPQFIEINGATVSFREAGVGETVILVHGSGCSNTQWRAAFTTWSSRYHILAPDLYGYGGTAPWPGTRALTLGDEAEIVGAMMAQAGGRCHLVGHSYGGAVALQAAHLAKVPLASLTLIEPVAFYLLRNGTAADRGKFAEIDSVARDLARAATSGDYRGGMERFVDYWNGDGAWRAMKPAAQSALAQKTLKVAQDFWTTTTEPTAIDAFGRIETPTQILYGTASPRPTRRIARLLAETIPGARLRPVAGGGHMMPLVQPEIVNPIIARHIARTSKSAPALKAA